MDISAIAGSGMSAAQMRFEKAGMAVAAATEEAPTDVVELISAKNDFSANARVAHVADEMQKTLLNVLA
ncbi:MAG TPA: hypothetical protein VG456_19310 [Candidatus Sulfopaludibacter sp.]|jgi:flagellar basal body rod protein FlgC|nr:hypothetical protein [Candidatus Sulfopaludibacter sp.]